MALVAHVESHESPFSAVEAGWSLLLYKARYLDDMVMTGVHSSILILFVGMGGKAAVPNQEQGKTCIPGGMDVYSHRTGYNTLLAPRCACEAVDEKGISRHVLSQGPPFTVSASVLDRSTSTPNTDISSPPMCSHLVAWLGASA